MTGCTNVPTGCGVTFDSTQATSFGSLNAFGGSALGAGRQGRVGGIVEDVVGGDEVVERREVAPVPGLDHPPGEGLVRFR